MENDPLLGEWVNKLWYIHSIKYSIKYYLMIKKEQCTFIYNNMNGFEILLMKEDKHIFSFSWNSRKGKIILNKSRSVIPLSWEHKRIWKDILEDGNVLYVDFHSEYMPIWIFKYLLKYTIKWGNLLYVNYTSINLI